MTDAPIITFYSFKGGVGRTLALLGVAEHLTRAGNTVLCVDFDLEAPGLAWELEQRGLTPPPLGISDLILQLLDSSTPLPVAPFVTTLPPRLIGQGDLHVLTTGARPAELSREIAGLFEPPRAPKADIFLYTLDELRRQLQPDFVLLDSRTGLADIAGVCTLELPDLIVAFSALHPQSVRGMEHDFLRRWLAHDARRAETAMILVASPVHDPASWREPPLRDSMDELLQGLTPPALLQEQRPLWRRYTDLQARLLAPLLRHAEQDRWWTTWPGLDREAMFHVLSYDPLAALGESQPDPPLDQDHQRLAHTLSCMRPGWGKPVPAPSALPPPPWTLQHPAP